MRGDMIVSIAGRSVTTSYLILPLLPPTAGGRSLPPTPGAAELRRRTPSLARIREISASEISSLISSMLPRLPPAPAPGGGGASILANLKSLFSQLFCFALQKSFSQIVFKVCDSFVMWIGLGKWQDWLSTQHHHFSRVHLSYYPLSCFSPTVSMPFNQRYTALGHKSSPRNTLK